MKPKFGSFSVNTHVHMWSHLVSLQSGTPLAIPLPQARGAANNASRRVPLIEAASEQQGPWLD